MYELIIKIAPHTKKPDYEKWANIIRLMREVDKIPLVTIQQVFNWANSDDFWKTNILSASKLRKQFNQLQAKMVNTNEQNRSNGTSAPNRLSAVDRVRARTETNRAARADNRNSVADVGGCVRVNAGDSVRGSDAGSLDNALEGSYTVTDQGRAEQDSQT